MEVSNLRSRLAATVLLSPFAALLAQPAFAQHRDVVVQATLPVPAVVVRDERDYGWDYGRDHDGRRHGWRRDERAPQIVDVTPEPGERAGGRFRTLVGARFIDQGSGVDVGSVRLRIDGYDVTGASRVSPEEIRFRDVLRPGRHYAEVVVRDHAGNAARHTWRFFVPDRGQERIGYGYGNAGDWGRN